MTIHALRDCPLPEMAAALADFESRFTYPLGPGRSFRISHDDDYPRFFRAMGEARCFVAERAGRVIGVLGVAVRPLILPDGTTRQTAYIGDLKVDPAARGSTVFLRLAQAADAWVRPQVLAAYGIVMDGTRASPTDYTGRLGVESFRAVGKVMVLRFAAVRADNDPCRTVQDTEGDRVYRSLSVGRYAAAGGDPVERSVSEPQWLVEANGLACGRLEDTARGKRLFDNDGNEMRSAHLACFAWRTPAAAAEVLHAARRRAAERGFGAMFVAVAEQEMPALEPVLRGVDRVTAPATIFAASLPVAAPWNVNTSEI